jgi:SPP1 gp7 family putative phage head morphogenesis protein
MAFRELKTLSRDAYLQERIAALREIYLSVQIKLMRQIKAGELTEFGAARANAILAEVKTIVAGLNRNVYRWAKSAIPDAYEQGIDLAAERLKALNVVRHVSYDAGVHTSAVNVLVNEVALDMVSTNIGIEKFFNRFIRQTQQKLIEDAEISKQIAQGVIEGQARRTVSDDLLKSLREKMGDQKFIFINGRNYRPDKYAELVARTRTREATTQGTINTSLHYGMDLVQWDIHSEICEYCQQYAGRVYSISGNDENFPALKEQPPLHPHCRCVLIPVTFQHLERSGVLDETIKLSRSKLIDIDSFAKYEEALASL